MTDDTAERPPILVGVDASGASRDALRWAGQYAPLVGNRLEVVHAWSVRQEYVWVPEVPLPPTPHDVAGKGLTEMVHEVVGADSRLAVIVDVVEGNARHVLVERSRRAELLAVGSRGHGGFDGLTLGSVSGHCAGHAHCAVTIARPSIGA